MRPCYTFKAQAAGKPAILAIDDEIGFWGTQAKDFRSALDGVSGDLDVEINSPGGDVFAGLGMFNMIRSFAASGKKVTTRVTGVAASIASIIMLAGDKREMPKNTFAMIHSPMTGTYGTAEELRETADTVDKIGASLRDIYVNRMGMKPDAVDAMMAKDTWLTADECLDNGFATDLIADVVATAKFDMARAELPANVQAVFKAKEVEKTPEELAAEAEAQRVEDEAAALVANPVTDQITARAKALGLEAHGVTFALACTSLADAEVRMQAAREIVALCALVKRPEDATVHIKANKTVAEVRTALITAQAEADTHTSNTPPRKTNASNVSSGVNSQSIWNSHRKQQPKKGR